MTEQTRLNKLYLCDSYLINIEKNVGRLASVSNIIKLMDLKVWKGIDPNKTDEDGYVQEWNDSAEMELEKMSINNLIMHFLANSKNQYLAIFEDNIEAHKDLFIGEKYNIIINKINNVLKFKKPSLIYLGTNKNIIDDKLDLSMDNLAIDPLSKLFDGKKISPMYGSFAFIINRTVASIILARIKNKIFKDKPFDMFCLSYLVLNDIKNIYITTPPLFVQNNRQLIKPNDNYFKNVYGAIICQITNQIDLEYFTNLVKIFENYFHIYYVDSSNVIDLDNEPKLLNMVKTESDIVGLEKYSVVLHTSTDIKFKYMDGKKIVEYIKLYENKVRILKIYDSLTHNIIFEIKYNNLISIGNDDHCIDL